MESIYNAKPFYHSRHSITAGSGSKGSWGQILSALTYDVYGLMLWINTGWASATQETILLILVLTLLAVHHIRL
jgi:hypothetical protein